MQYDRIDIASATGVDPRLNIAGPGARSYAFVIDWHIRLLLALAWWSVATLLYVGDFISPAAEDIDFTGYLWIVLVPAIGIYTLYHPVLEIAMRGRTPGKRMAGIRITTLEGELPGVLAHLIRNLLRLLDSLPAAYAIGLAATLVTRNSVRIGDLAAGTLLIYDSDPRSLGAGAALADTAAVDRLGLVQAELCQDLLDRWDHLEDAKRRALALHLLQRLAPEARPHPDSRGLYRQVSALLEDGAER